MKSVTVNEECIGCEACVEICPEVFEMDGDMAIVRGDADLSQNSGIIESAEDCPAEAIEYVE